MTRRRAAPFLERIKARFDLISEYPEIGRAREEIGAQIRSISHGRCIISYRRSADRAEIVRVMHGHRDLRGGPALTGS